MTITDPMAAAERQRSRDATGHGDDSVTSPEDLIHHILELRAQAYRARRRIPGRNTLARMTGEKPYRVRQALEEIDRRHHRHDGYGRPSANPVHPVANGVHAGAPAGSAVPSRAAEGSEPPQLVSWATNGPRLTSHAPREDSDRLAPAGASTSGQPTKRPGRPLRDIPGGVARAAVLLSMFALAAAVWVKAADLSGHQVELAVLPVVNWPVRLAYFAPIMVEGAVYAAIRTCHTLEYAREATRIYARRTAAIGLVAMVLVGALVGLGLADEPYVRDGIGGLIGGLGPFMGWRTSRASAMVAGDRRVATADGTIIAESAAAQPNRFVDLLNTLATAATARVTSWSNASHPGASSSPSPGAEHPQSRRQGSHDKRE